MSKKDGNKSKSPVKTGGSKMERIGILFKSFVKSIPMGPHTHQCSYQRWNAGQILTDAKEIEMLKGLNAPMGVYYRDVDKPTEG